jgi:L-aminopeptidase/D-esterase-like protein
LSQESLGFRIGHWTGAGTGVTVILCSEGTIGSCEIRGGAPATRETALLEPGRSVERVDAVVLTGGSAFGLATADGVMAWLAERERGFPTRGGPVPIVPTAAIYDLAVGGDLRPGADEGRAAADAAETAAAWEQTSGRLGAGTGATIGKWRGAEHAVPGGLGVASRDESERAGSRLGALAVVNAVGDVVDAGGSVVAGSSAPADAPAFPDPESNLFEATTLVVVATDARLTKLECHLVAQSGHDGLATALRPSHTRYDGDLVIALAMSPSNPSLSNSSLAGGGSLDREAPEAPGFALDRLRMAATEVVAEAVRNAVRQT